MKPRMVEVSKFDGSNWIPWGTAVFHGFFSDYEEFQEGPGNYPAALIEWEDGRVESVVARSIRFLVPTLEAEKIKDQIIRENLGMMYNSESKELDAAWELYKAGNLSPQEYVDTIVSIKGDKA